MDPHFSWIEIESFGILLPACGRTKLGKSCTIWFSKTKQPEAHNNFIQRKKQHKTSNNCIPFASLLSLSQNIIYIYTYIYSIYNIHVYYTYFWISRSSRIKKTKHGSTVPSQPRHWTHRPCWSGSFVPSPHFAVAPFRRRCSSWSLA